MNHMPTSRVYICIALTSAVLYFNTIFSGFVFDDISAIANNPDLDPEVPWSTILWNDYWGTPMSQEGSHKSYRPFTVATFKLNMMIFGKEPFSYHLVNVILHSLVCVLYYHAVQIICSTGLMHSKCNDRRSKSSHNHIARQHSDKIIIFEHIPLMATALFLTHPIHCEAVAGVVGRAELLSALFMLLVFIFYSKFQVLSQCCAVFFLVCAVGSKEQGITVTAICAVYDMFVANKLTPFELISFYKTSNIFTGLRVCVLAFAACLLLLWRIILMNDELPIFTFFDNPASYSETPFRQLTFNFLITQNFWLLLNPSTLLCDWTFGTVPIINHILDIRNFATVIFYTALLVISSYAAFAKKVTAKVLLMALSFLILPFLPASNLFFPVGFVVAERVLYVPSMGYCLLVALGMSKLLTFSKLRKFIIGFGVFLMLCFSVKTVHRNLDWQSQYSLFQSGLKVTRDNAKLWNNVGHTLEINDPETALLYFKEAARIQPDDIGSHMNSGRILKRLGLIQEAEKSYLTAKDLFPKQKNGEITIGRVAPEHLQLFVQLGNLMKQDKSRLSEVDALYKEAINYRNDFIDAYINRGEILILMDRLDEAVKCYEAALMYTKKKDDVYFNLAVVHSQNGNVTGAVEYYTYAIQENPNHVKALYNSAVIFEETGNKDLIRRAKVRVERVLKLQPDNHLALSLMGSIYLDNGDEKSAHKYWEKTLRVHPNDKSALYNMALMYSKKSDKLELTLKTIEQLLDSHPNHIKALMLYGEMLLNRKKDRKGAGEVFQRINAIDPSHTQARHNYCVVVLQEGRLYDAEKCMEEVLAVAPDAKYVADNLALIRKHIARKKTEQLEETVKFSPSQEKSDSVEQIPHKSVENEEEQEDFIFVEPARKKNTYSKRARSILEDAQKVASDAQTGDSRTRLGRVETALEKVKSSVKKLTTISRQVTNDLNDKCPISEQKVMEEEDTTFNGDALEDLRNRALKALDDLEAGLD